MAAKITQKQKLINSWLFFTRMRSIERELRHYARDFDSDIAMGIADDMKEVIDEYEPKIK